jgi:hypothetical protein
VGWIGDHFNSSVLQVCRLLNCNPVRLRLDRQPKSDSLVLLIDLLTNQISFENVIGALNTLSETFQTNGIIRVFCRELGPLQMRTIPME